MSSSSSMLLSRSTASVSFVVLSRFSSVSCVIQSPGHSGQRQFVLEMDASKKALTCFSVPDSVQFLVSESSKQPVFGGSLRRVNSSWLRRARGCFTEPVVWLKVLLQKMGHLKEPGTAPKCQRLRNELRLRLGNWLKQHKYVATTFAALCASINWRVTSATLRVQVLHEFRAMLGSAPLQGLW